MKSPGRWLRRIGVTLLVLAVLLALPVLPPITISSFPTPPGEDSLELVVNKGYDLNAVAEVFLGRQYRDLWAQPVTVKVLDLASVEGGLRPTRQGGGNETRSLHFETTDGRRFIFRSVDKENIRLLNAGLWRTPVAWLVHDQTSSSFPAAALVANPLQESVGVASGHPRLVVMADDARLGEYRAKFAGILGLLQEGPEDYVRLIPDGAAVNEVKDTEGVLPLADGSSRHRMDPHSFLTARLVDGFLNDWDRHAGQWRWAPVQERWGTRWLAIPVDRDQAFSSYDGVLMALARLRTRKLAVFGPELPSVKGLTYNSRHLDRRFLAGLDRKTWDSTAAFVAGRLTDSVIDAAVKRLPEPWYRLEGAKLATTLKRRRGRLAAFATTFYLYMAKHSEVFATMEAETAHLDYQPDGGVEVRVGSMAGGREQEPWFVRRYRPAETGRIDLHLGGGKDRVIRSGTPSRTIAVHVFDEKGREVAMSQFLDTSGIRP